MVSFYRKIVSDKGSALLKDNTAKTQLAQLRNGEQFHRFSSVAHILFMF